MTVLIVVETVILLVLSVLVVGLLRAYATVLQRLHRLDGGAELPSAPPFRTASGVMPPPGGEYAATGAGSGSEEWADAHDIVGEGLSGEVISVRTVAVPHDTVLVFLSSGCSGCTGFWEQFVDGTAVAAVGRNRLLVVTKSAEEESISLLRELSPPGVDLVMSSTAWADYDVPGSPYVIVVDGRTGRVKGEGSGVSLQQVSGLMQQAYGDGADLRRCPAGGQTPLRRRTRGRCRSGPARRRYRSRAPEPVRGGSTRRHDRSGRGAATTSPSGLVTQAGFWFGPA